MYYELRTTNIRSIRKNLTMLKKEKIRDRRWYTDKHIATDHRRSNYRDSTVRHAASKDHNYSNEKCAFCYKHDLKSKKTIFVGINSLFSLINIIKTESNNLLSNHT